MRKNIKMVMVAAMFMVTGLLMANAGVVINEVLAVNDAVLADENGEFSDWIELYNGGTSTVDLAGWFLTDDSSDLDKWEIPSVSLVPGEYLVVFASNKDRRSGELHTNFKLSGSGEYLALVGTNGYSVVHEYAPGYPEQLEDISFGVSSNLVEVIRYFATPTPGSANGGEYLGLVADTKFSADRGFYSNAFTVAIATDTQDAAIHYTLDGSTPTQIHGTPYSVPISVTNTTLLRAMAWKPGYKGTDVDTQTYLFLDDVIGRSADAPGPDWPAPGVSVNAQVMDYEMDPRVTGDPRYTNMIREALVAIPTISIVTDLDNLFDATIGIYVNSRSEGDLWERPVSAELIYPDGSDGFQEDAGLRIRGGASRNPAVPKHGFRLRFRNTYGASKLQFKIFGDDGPDASNGVDLRCSQTPGWHYFSGPSVFARDIYARDLQIAQGQPSTRGDKYHLYLNGVYWGMYETQENIEPSFMAENWGGDEEDYDIIIKKKHGHSVDGSDEAYRDLWEITMAGFTGDAGMSNYFRVQGLDVDGLTPNPSHPRLLDIVSLADYMLVHYWVGERDGMAGAWGLNNYICAYNREDPDGFKYFKYDSEWSLDVGIANTVTRTDTSTDFSRFNALIMHGRLVQNQEYLLAFADQTYKHLYNDGIMTPGNAVALFRKRTDEIDIAIVGESARWGDSLTPDVPKTRDDEWIPDVNATVNWIQNRTATVMTQLRAAGWYPTVDPPTFSKSGGMFTNGFELAMTAADSIYYTLDGTDPRQIITGTPVGTSYGTAVTLTETTLVKARAFDGSTWSALNEAVFTLATPPTLDVTQIMYNPRDAEGAETNVTSNADAFEFLELRNTGPDTVGLAGLNFSEGIDFDFTEMDDLFLDPGERLLLVRDLDAFAARYDTSGLRIAGEYDGALDNAGERITLVDGIGSNVISLAYDDARGWPQAADGAGHSLVPLAADGLSYGGNWRASAFIDGSPGLADPTPVHDVVLNEFAAHTDYTNAAKPEYDSNDWLELFNTRTNAISLSNFYLSDDPGALRKWAIPATNTVAGGGYLSFDEVTGFHSPITSGFGLNKAGEALYLSYLPGTAQDRVVDCLRFKGQENGATLGRYPDGADWWYTTVPTPGTTNALAAEHVVINQLMTHPADGTNEYIVLYNPSATPAELWNAVGPYRIDGGVSYDFPSNTMIAARDYATLVPFSPTNSAAVAAFETAYGLPAGQTYLLGPFDGKLDNVGDRVALERPQAPDAEGEGVSWVIVDEVIYSGYSPWPTNVHANGNALQRIDGRHSGNDPSNWVGQPAGLVPAKIFITYPWAGSTLDMPFDVEVVATVDPNQVSGSVQRVDFFLDEVLLGTDATSPYGAAMNYTHVSNITSYTLRADLVDDAGTNRSVEIVFHADHADRVHLVDPLDGLSLVAPFTQLVRAGVDMDHVLGTIDNVSFYSGTNLLYTDPTAPYEFLASDLDLPPTRWHDLTATVLDDFGPTTSRVVSLYSYDSVWSNATYRMKVHFPGYLGDERVQEFPALVTLSEGIPGFSYSQVASPTGADLRFADHTGTNIVVHEIESWDTNGSSIVWVRLPELYSTNTWIWAYWGDPDATLPSYATDGSVWENDYELVMHMAETGGRTARDASTNAYGASFEVWVSYAWQQSGAIGPAVRFGDNFASLLLTPDVPMGTEWTLSAWFKDLAGTAANRILTETASGDSPAIVFSGGNSLGSEDGGPSPCGYELTGSSEWRRLTAVGDDSGTRYFIDGEQVGSISNRVGGSLASIGNMSSGFGTERFARYLDEVRFSSTVRSEDWIAASWLNQASNGVFVTFGPAERQEPSGEPEPDSDNDGMLDAWEDEYLGGTGADPEADPDGDGMRNREEFIAGTDPTNALSLFDLSLQWSGGQLLVVFEAEDAVGYGPGYQRFYSLRGATNLLSPTWVGVGGHTNIPGSGQTVIYTNPAGAAPVTFRGEVWLTE